MVTRDLAQPTDPQSTHTHTHTQRGRKGWRECVQERGEQPRAVTPQQPSMRIIYVAFNENGIEI